MNQPILPGQTLGILGGGQLGRMLAMVARRQGYRVHVLSGEAESPASDFANHLTFAADDDHAAWKRFADSVDVVTLEFENLPAAALEQIVDRVPIRPGLNVLRTCQNRIAEKCFLRDAGISLPRFGSLTTPDDLASAWQSVGGAAVLKTAGGGYDGKGQAVVRTRKELEQAWSGLRSQPCTLEALIDLDCEFSVIVARDCFGGTTTYGPIRNRHAHHILDLSWCPAGFPESMASAAAQTAIRIAEQFQLIGLICVEYFLSRTGELFVNEIAPRPHNSGHLTIEGFACSQFEQQLRCVTGFPVAPARQVRPVAMVNLLGDIWEGGPPHWDRLGPFEECHLHLYGKSEPRPGRKMGHLTVAADEVDTAISRAEEARDSLRRSSVSASTAASAKALPAADPCPRPAQKITGTAAR